MADDQSDVSPTNWAASPATSWAGQSFTLVPVDHDPFNDSWAAGSPVYRPAFGTLPQSEPGPTAAPNELWAQIGTIPGMVQGPANEASPLGPANVGATGTGGAPGPTAGDQFAQPGPVGYPAGDSQGVAIRLPNGQTVPNYESTGDLMSPVADLGPVAAAGRQAGATYLSLLNNPETSETAILYLLGRLGNNLGQGGTFDYQRRGHFITGYTHFPQFRDVSNFNVGLFCQQAGLTLEQTQTIAGSYAHLFSGNADPNKPHGQDVRNARFTATGFDIGQSGVFGPPATP